MNPPGATASAVLDQPYLARARALVEAIENGSGEEVERLVDELTTLRETQLYQQLGKLTRELHDSVVTFSEDARVCSLAHNEIPSARERLKHVITLTQESADKTLNAVEACVPLAKGISDRSTDLSERWARFRARRLSLEEFRTLSAELDAFLLSTRTDADSLHAGLSDVLMAQGFQDLTGQIIQRVIGLVDEVEEKLVAIVSFAGARFADESAAEDPTAAHGPPIPALQGGDVVSGQDEVDDLLSSLGF